MEDRAYSQIIINSQFKDIVDFWNETNGFAVQREISPDGMTIQYISEFALFGRIPWLERLLDETAIPFDQSWSNAKGVEAGGQALRISRDEHGTLIKDHTRWTNDHYSLSIEEICAYFDEGKAEKLWKLATERKDYLRVTPAIADVTLEPEHEELRNTIWDDKLSLMLQAQMHQAAAEPHLSASSQCLEISTGMQVDTDTMMIIIELLYHQKLPEGLTAALFEFINLFGATALRQEVRRISAIVASAFKQTEAAANGYRASYADDWMPAFLHRTLNVDLKMRRLNISPNCPKVAFRIGEAYRQGRKL